ncbi:MAG: 16S rRNA (cytosine(1402)-N(4))-methyltransferase RsmH [Polyangiaceae bacterium]
MSAQLALPGLAEDFGSDRVEWVWSEDEEEVNVVEHFVHATVMRDEVVQALAPRAGGIYVDATLGGGGHTEGILEVEPDARVIAFDRDAIAIAAAKHRLERFEERVDIVHAPFGQIERELERMGISRVSGICADLGVSSPQLDDPLRGMSFQREGPIDMRMDADSGETAREMIERMDDDELANVIYNYGDERRSRRIARSIHRALEAGELETTLDLRRAIVRAVGPVRVGGVDPATRTFQALRIAVNGEISELETLLAALPKLVEIDGAAAILTFHSLEDRPVKRAFADRSTWTPIWKKFLAPSDEETAQNPRARSAKLRASRRHQTPEEA